MNFSLFASMLKTKGKTMFSYAFGTSLYLLLIISVYPAFADSDALNEVMRQMPENLKNILGLKDGLQGLDSFVAAEYYGLLYIIILTIYCVVTATQLIARMVDRGSMAYLLSTPVSRTRIALTQAAILLFGLLLITVLTIASGLLGTWWIVGGNVDLSSFIQLNLVGFLLFFVISGYSFFFSCLCNDEKQALSISGGLTVVFFALDLAAKMSQGLAWMKNITLFTAFHPSDIANGTVDALPICLMLAAAGIALYAAAVIVFRGRNLPL